MDAAELETLKARVAAAEKVNDVMHRNGKAMNLPMNAQQAEYRIYPDGEVHVSAGGEYVSVLGVGKELLEHISMFFAGKVHAAVEEFKAI